MYGAAMIRRILIALALVVAAFASTGARADSLCIDVDIPDGELRDFPYCVVLP
jgi:hypothetical protein